MHTPHTPHAPQRQETETEKANGKKSSPMQQLRREEVAHHTRPAPRAQPPEIDPFPPGIRIGLWTGVAGGALLGLIIGNLLFQGVIQIEGIEGLFSMPPSLSMHSGCSQEPQLDSLSVDWSALLAPRHP